MSDLTKRLRDWDEGACADWTLAWSDMQEAADRLDAAGDILSNAPSNGLPHVLDQVIERALAALTGEADDE